MADAEKLRKKKSNLPSPPLEEVSENIHPRNENSHYERIDGRSLRRTGRTIQFNTKVTPGFDKKLREIAIREGLTLAEVLEKALNNYDKI